MGNLETAKKAISEEINRLANERARLDKVLAALSDGFGAGNGSAIPKVQGTADQGRRVEEPGKRRRGRPRKSSTPQPGDVDGTLKLIKDAGKDGINAIALSYAIRNAGIAKPSKAELMDSGKIKTTGTRGGIVYKFIG